MIVYIGKDIAAKISLTRLSTYSTPVVVGHTLS